MAELTKMCIVQNCTKPARKKRMCSMHASRLARTGTTDPPETRVDRYHRLVVRSASGCWGWSGAINNAGYGRLGVYYAHRISYEIHNGPIPAGMLVMHSCDNPPRTNPKHLLLGTHADNRHDAASKGRLLGYGISPKPKKLSPDAVAQIRAARTAGVPRAEIARQFGISIQHVSNIAPRTRRQHV